jgi:hypothetical protein
MIVMMMRNVVVFPTDNERVTSGGPDLTEILYRSHR